MAKFGSALTADRFQAQKMINDAINRSSNLAEVMECVGAMYGIPSSNILVDDTMKSVKVVNDNIICPSNVGAGSNINTVMRSIGAVLDQISSRINDKVTNLQISNIEQGKESDEVASRSDPSKGKVVATHKDANGDLVLVYDSGIIDAAHTAAGIAKAAELRNTGNIPAMDPLTKSKPSYFTDEDDLMKGVNDTPTVTATEYCISSIINESDYFIDAVSRFGGTSNLGHAILTYHGYDCVQPTMNVVQEAAESTSKKINPEEIKYMKFDNSKIYKAIEYLNEARKKQTFLKNVEDLDVETFVRDPDYQKAIDCLEDQFDCKLSIKWIHATKPESFAGTEIISSEYRTKLTVSKSKGFQLGGAPINIYIVEDGVTELISDKPELFGQGFISIMLHEIFHNIAGIMRYENAQFVTTLTVAIEEACETRDPKVRRMILEKYVNTLNTQMNGKLNRTTKKIMVKRMMVLIAAKSDAKLMAQYTNALDKDSKKNPDSSDPNKKLQKATSIYAKAIKKADREVKSAKSIAVLEIVLGSICIVTSLFISFTPLMFASFITGFLGGYNLTKGIIDLAGVNKYKKFMQKYKNSKQMEEYYCDLMSGMYQLPQRFFTGYPLVDKKYTANEFDQETLDEWVKIEKLFYEAMAASYPTTSERTWTGVTIAKKLLECKNLDKNVEEYLKWVVDNNDNILKSNIKDDYNSVTFDPEEAEDLDKHMTALIKNNKVTVTEAAIEALVDSSELSEWIAEGMQYTESEIAFQELCDLINECNSIYQEFNTSRNVTGYKDESIGKRILMFIPRLIANCLEIVWRFIRGVGQSTIDGLYKLFTPNKLYTINCNILGSHRILIKDDQIVEKLSMHFEDVVNLEDYLKKIDELDFDKIYTHWGMDKRMMNINNLDVEGTYEANYKSLDEHSRFHSYDNALKDEKFQVMGKQLCDTIADIHKIGNRMTPKLRKLLAQAKRLTQNEDTDVISKLTNEQKKKLKVIIGCYEDIYRTYNTIYSWIFDFRRKRVKPTDSEASLKKEGV